MEVLQTAHSRFSHVLVHHMTRSGKCDRMYQAGQTYLSVIDRDGKAAGVLPPVAGKDRVPAV